jgi:hypothetical protein
MYYINPEEKVFTIPELRLIILSYALEDKKEEIKRYECLENCGYFIDEAWKQLTWIGLCVLVGMVLLSMIIR